jgi:hypothetical protein
MQIVGNLMLYTSTKMTPNNSKTKGGESPNVQVMKLSNQILPDRNDFTSFVMNIFAKMCFFGNYILPSLPNILMKKLLLVLIFHIEKV